MTLAIYLFSVFVIAVAAILTVMAVTTRAAVESVAPPSADVAD